MTISSLPSVVDADNLHPSLLNHEPVWRRTLLDNGKYCMLGAADNESSELQKCKNSSMRSLVIFPAAQELQEWSCLASGMISTEAVRSLVNYQNKEEK